MSSIPYSLLLFRKNKQGSKVKCDSCGEIHRTRHTILFKGKILCHHCKLRLPSLRLNNSISGLINPSYSGFSLEKALERTYEVKATPYGTKGRFNIHFSPSLTKSLIGHKVKLQLIK